ncbi:MFS transporter [Bradyrhizobium sp. LHD-71]|uniref:MFS transporter n=1 Tax=Bradyrhizobium sp. LHD-71 TaxID=3072141 RepID=UPI0028100395|nr:MFS transporter [Bradyrhizobium sp. LHD-71]MDQ8728698.1 MFS transporter [Bradyrhizobium sp. LHD-71]
MDGHRRLLAGPQGRRRGGNRHHRYRHPSQQVGRGGTAIDPAPGPTRAIAVAALCFGTIAVQFDSAVNIAFPDLVRAFALPIPDIQWIVIAYTLTYAALMLVFGRAGDIFGHRAVFLLGAAISAVAFALCAISTAYGWLLAARVLQGVGAALALSCGPALITSLYAEEHRARVLSLYTLLIGFGGAIAPVVGGLLVERWGWPAVFAFRVPLALAALAAGFALPAGKARAVREGFDGWGAALLVLAIAVIVLALNQLQGRDQLLLSLALLGGSAVLGAAFVWREVSVDHPIIDVRYFRDADFALLNVAHMLLNLAGFAIFLLAPFYLHAVGNLSAPAAGLVLAASPIGLILGAPAAARLAGAIHARRMALIGAALSATGLLAISLLGDRLSLLILVLASSLQGFGVGLFQVAYFDIATATLPKKDRGVAGSLVLMTRTVGIVMGASVLMLAFRALSEAGSTDAGQGSLLAGFSGAFAIAGSISLLVVVLALARGWARKDGRA